MTTDVRTTHLLVLLVLALQMPVPAAAATEPIIVRACVENADADIWVGQRVIFQVDVLARDGWAKIKSARDFEVPGAYVVRLQTQGTRLNETISGFAYAGQRYELSLFAQKDGKITVPPVPIDVEISRWGDQPGTESRRLNTPALAFDAKIPPGAEKQPGIISTTELKARQAWTPQSQVFKVGDAVKRTIVRNAVDISGMAFTPLVYPAISGVRIYADEPAVEDQFNRGALIGERTERVTYLFERQGEYKLPEIVITYWDLGAKELKKDVLASLEVKISAGSGAGGRTGWAPVVGRKMQMGRLLSAVVPLALLAAIAWRFRHGLQSCWREWQHARKEREKAYFRRFREACRQNDAKAAYHRLLTWWNLTASERHPNTGGASLKTLLETTGNAELTKAVGDLEKRLFKKSTGPEAQNPWQGNTLSRELARWRQKRKRTVDRTLTGEATLAPLNPQ
ncbi:MAG: hypothetical protein HKP58_16750 [Desulfatitalea sp.]|nr:BatD family protein [Desulfatitalea sp.]NNK02064.1 hypothetical protein [Desulfatitalea sp.]